MAIKTLLEFATDKVLIRLLAKERAKQIKYNKSDKHHILNRSDDFEKLITRKKLSRLMPPRYDWVHPQKRIKKPISTPDKRKNMVKALLHTIARDKCRQTKGDHFAYLDELQTYLNHIRELISSPELSFQRPNLFPIYKDHEQLADSTYLVTCRPLAVYSQLDDKIILALTSQYLTRYFDCYLHKNILSYRPLRTFDDEERVTDFNDGIKLIDEFRKAHASQSIYAADCDIKKFYDIIPHCVVRECFSRMLDKSPLNSEGKSQVMRVLNAYLNSYNFYENAWLEAERNETVFWKVRKRFHDKEKKNTYQIGWPHKELGEPRASVEPRGVAQGGSLSLLVANVVLNDVDQPIIASDDPERLFIRYCDDMILLHTNYDECNHLMKVYSESLDKHGLIYHPFKYVSDCSRREFWNIKSHHPFLWGEGSGNSNRYIGFLGYEISRNGIIRLRKSNVQRFDEKLNRLKYALRRIRKKNNPTVFFATREEKLNNVFKSFSVYTALDQDKFKYSHQYRYVERLVNRFLNS